MYTETDLHLSIKNLAEEDRPREKLLLKGRQALSDAELIALLIGSGTPKMSAITVAQLLLNAANNQLNTLAGFSIKDLKQIQGIGDAKAVTITAALELGRRRKLQETKEKVRITCSKDIYELLSEHLLDLNHEELWIVLLNRGNQVLGTEKVSMGGMTGTVADPKIIFKKALEKNACSIILSHNHPSGNVKPSQADISLTKKVKAAGQFMELPVLDHLIFGNEKYFSFADEGIL
ncbi:DNA repair protein RadC [Flammeovirga yaeyamensis]|uniref:DNA repair protein RadC n=1 Tax=Flammeovirga yaeyamensis TaxID=367791 RepID=A0AAX1N606_9BACT|nr:MULTISPECIES: DNA repair protein RadC [Flammeovirga]ANQ51293.1 DNA repair protein RadC [Flammeovirga sp. MY04]MBB3698347.1 DNA repair protein RadC [Flammeovirga yaeyamensis]NMF34300.1 DNA repair protein RadC [Flammeovirga yaeyamensis]QWG01283.1 DNA repair protein RadC [Flammeovirga yaeyamensis]